MADATVALSNSPPKSEPGTKRQPAKRAALYTRVSTADQHPETHFTTCARWPDNADTKSFANTVM